MAHILVVDDDANIRGIVGRFLERHYDVSFAENGQQALEELKVSDFDLVISDMRMPVMDGDILLEQMRHQGLEMPFLAMSGHVLAEGVSLMADGFIAKPFMLSELLLRVQSILDKVPVN